jgi:hypothetical protein
MSHPECFTHALFDLRKKYLLDVLISHKLLEKYCTRLCRHSKYSNYFRETYSIAYLQDLTICDEIWLETIDLLFYATFSDERMGLVGLMV